MSAGLSTYKGLTVAKVFPGHNDGKPFRGVVTEVDTRDKRSPFHIVYDDGDEEWVSLKELRKITVEPLDAATKKAKPASDVAKKRSKVEVQADAAAAAKDEHPAKKTKDINSLMAANDVAGTNAAAADFDAEKAKRDMKGRKDTKTGIAQFTISAAAAAALDTDADHDDSPDDNDDDNDDDQDHDDEDETESQDHADQHLQQQPKVQAAAACAGGAPAGQTAAGSSKAAAVPVRKSTSKPAAAAPPASPMPHLPDLLNSINQAAPEAANQLAQDRQTARLPYNGSGAPLLPRMSQVVLSGGQCYLSLCSRPPPRTSTTPGRVLTDSREPDYQPEAEGLLTELDKLLTHSSSSKSMLLKVTVTLRDLQNGLPGFKAAWDAWVDKAALPVVTLYEGSSVFTHSNITLEATALTM